MSDLMDPRTLTRLRQLYADQVLYYDALALAHCEVAAILNEPADENDGYLKLIAEFRTGAERMLAKVDGWLKEAASLN